MKYYDEITEFQSVYCPTSDFKKSAPNENLNILFTLILTNSLTEFQESTHDFALFEILTES